MFQIIYDKYFDIINLILTHFKFLFKKFIFIHHSQFIVTQYYFTDHKNRFGYYINIYYLGTSLRPHLSFRCGAIFYISCSVC